MDEVHLLGFALSGLGDLAREFLVAAGSRSYLRYLHHPQGPLEFLEETLQGGREAQFVERMARCRHLCRHRRHLHQHLLLPGVQDSFLLDGEQPLYRRPPLRQQIDIWPQDPADPADHSLHAQYDLREEVLFDPHPEQVSSPERTP